MRIVTTGILHSNSNHPDNIYWWPQNIALLTNFIATQLASQHVAVLDIRHYDGRANPYAGPDGHAASKDAFDRETGSMLAVVPTILSQYGHHLVQDNFSLDGMNGEDVFLPVLLLDFANAFYQIGGDLSSVRPSLRRISVGYENWDHYFATSHSSVNVRVDDQTLIEFKL